MEDEMVLVRGRIGWFSRIPWNAVADVGLRVTIWLLLGSAINLFPVLIAYLLGAGEQQAANGQVSKSYTLNSILSAGDLLIAATVMLPPVLADLALNARKAKRTRVLIIVIGAFLSLVSIIFYGFAYANNLSREAHRTLAAVNLNADSVATWSEVFFLCAAALGAVCAGFLAAEKPASEADNAAEEPASEADNVVEADHTEKTQAELESTE
jgi:heme/copper-type cytochrome/quinol oxidase subunit 3